MRVNPIEKSLVAAHLSLGDVARHLGVHVATVWRWTLRGVKGRKLRSILIGGRRYVTGAALAEFLAPRDSSENKVDIEFHRRAADAGRLLDGMGVAAKGGAK